jgi:hypothetical protein
MSATNEAGRLPTLRGGAACPGQYLPTSFMIHLWMEW